MKIKGSFILDKYIVKKFLGTFVYALTLLMLIVIVFDISEKLDDFIENSAPLKEIIFNYYLNFIPYFALLFSPLFTFISVIFFTSKLANDSEIIAMFSSGLRFRRLLLPYLISALTIAAFTFLLGNYVIPHANQNRHEFEEIYIRKGPVSVNKRNIHLQVRPNEYVYMESYSNSSKTGYKFSMEKFSEDGKLESKLISDYVKWNEETNTWTVRNYYIRTIQKDGSEILDYGREIDTTMNIFPEEFSRRDNFVEDMNIKELKEFIAQQKLHGSKNITPFLIERYRRLAFPFSTFILTLIGMTLSSRKVRGGIGGHIGAGLGLSFAYILFMQFSSQFAIGGVIDPLLAVWMPNIIFAGIASVLYYFAPK